LDVSISLLFGEHDIEKWIIRFGFLWLYEMNVLRFSLYEVILVAHYAEDEMGLHFHTSRVVMVSMSELQCPLLGTFEILENLMPSD
jgi:hypothetical protein